MEFARSSRVAPGSHAAHQPPATLADGIAGVWARHFDVAPRVPPRVAVADGCAYLLFGFDVARAGRRDLIHTRLIGPRTRPFLIDERPSLCISVRFVPGFAQAAFGMPASELVDQRVDYDLVYANAAADLERIATAATDPERVAGALAIARRRYRSASRVPASVRAAVAHIALADGNVRVEPLAAAIGVTRQHLARQFAAHVGMTVKQFARVKRGEGARARAAVARAAHPGHVNWARIAHQLGYYDQAHFISDFKFVTGATPGRWIR